MVTLGTKAINRSNIQNRRSESGLTSEDIQQDPLPRAEVRNRYWEQDHNKENGNG